MQLALPRIGSKVYTTLAVRKLNRRKCVDPYNHTRLCSRSMKFLNFVQTEISNPELLNNIKNKNLLTK